MVLVYFELYVSKEKSRIKFILFFCFKADQVFGDEEMHSTVRQNCMDYIVSFYKKKIKYFHE